jgi:hypothetical protein
MRRNPELSAVLGELARVVLEDGPQVHNDRRHPLITWRAPGGPQRNLTVAGTPGDVFRGARNARARVRRWLKADGAQPIVRARKKRTRSEFRGRSRSGQSSRNA